MPEGLRQPQRHAQRPPVARPGRDDARAADPPLHPNLLHAADLAGRSATASQVQQSCGNRAVQRAVESTTDATASRRPVPVQRQEEEDPLSFWGQAKADWDAYDRNMTGPGEESYLKRQERLLSEGSFGEKIGAAGRLAVPGLGVALHAPEYAAIAGLDWIEDQLGREIF